MYSEWHISTIDDVCILVTDGAHNSPKSTTTGKYMASVKDFTKYGFDFSTCRKISYDDYYKLEKQGCVPNIGDVLVGKDGARYFEDIIIYNQLEKPALLSSIAILRVNPEIITPEFLYYTLNSPTVKNNVRDNYGSGSAIPRIVLKDFKRMPICYPKLEEQKKIVSLLVSIDKKIALNASINRNLEQQAQAIFKSWFVDFEPFQDGKFVDSGLGMIPKGWNCSPLANICLKITDGVHNTVIDDPKGSYLLLSCKNLKNGAIEIGNNERRINSETFQKLRSRTNLSCGDILMSSVGTIGELVLLQNYPNNIEFQRSVAILKPDKKIVSSYFLYESLLAMKDKIINSAHGAVQQCLFIGDIGQLTIVSPPIAEIQKFDSIVSSMFSMLEKNNQEILRLATIRDTLLPKLMSGEIDVSEVEV